MTHLIVICLLLSDSKSWTPKILSDIVNRKTIQGECKDYQDNPLELLPEKRSKVISKQTYQNVEGSSDPGKEQTLIKAINFLLTEVFCSHQQSPPIEEIMKGDSILVKSLNYLFVDTGDNKC